MFFPLIKLEVGGAEDEGFTLGIHPIPMCHICFLFDLTFCDQS